MPIIPGVSASSDGRQPTAPTIGTATAGNASATVAFTAPTYLGKPSTNNLYVAISSPGSITGSAAHPLTSISVTGLTNGTAYTFTVTAQTRNSNDTVIATSAASSTSNSVTPVVPGPFFPPFFPFFPPFFPRFGGF